MPIRCDYKHRTNLEEVWAKSKQYNNNGEMQKIQTRDELREEALRKQVLFFFPPCTTS